MQFISANGGGPPNVLPAQYIQQQQMLQGQVPSSGANIAYMTNTMPVGSVNFTASSAAAGELTYADLGLICPGGMLVGGGKKMQYTTATLGRPPRHPDLKRHEPTIYAQVRSSFYAPPLN